MRVLTVAGLVLIGTLASACSCDGAETSGQKAVLEWGLQQDPTKEADYLIDFGLVSIGDRKVEETSVGNSGNRELVISAGRIERPFSHQIPAGGLTIGVGASRWLTFSFEPIEATPEPIQAIVVLDTNEGSGRRRTVRLTGQGIQPSLRCEPAELAFGAVLQATSKTRTIACTNLLDLKVEVRIGRLRGAGAPFFSAGIPGAEGAPVPLAPGDSIEVEIGFRAETLGSHAAILELDDVFDQHLALIDLSATAVSSETVFEPETCLDFSYVGLGRSATLPLQVRTIGGRPVRVVGASLPEDQRENFSVVTELPLPLPEDGTSRNIEVEFHPSTAGPQQSWISFQIEDPLEGTYAATACVQGFGGGPALSCQPGRVDFGMVAVGAPVRRMLECVNVGVSIPDVTVDPLVVTGIRSTAEVFQARIFDPLSGAEGPKPGGYRLGESFGVEITYAPTAETFDSAAIEIETVSAPDGIYETPVSGQGRDLPLCEFSLAPRLLRFGIVERGESITLPFAIANERETPCLINDLRLGEGSDPAFSVEPIESLELAGRQSLLVPVTFAPSVYKALYSGAVELQISSSDRDQKVELRGSSAKPCLSIEPLHLDFGAIGPGCSSQEIYVTASNVCGTPLELLSLEVAENTDSVFKVRQRPMLPKTLFPNERAEFTLIFTPEEVGSYEGALIFEVKNSEPYLSSVRGEADPLPIQTDVFEQNARPKVDILWVIDNSGSFDVYQARVASNLPAFLTTANQRGIDYRIAVTTSGLLPNNDRCPGGVDGGEDGRFFPVDGTHPRILTPTTQNLEAHWAHNVTVGTCHATEEYFEAAYRALSPPLINETKSSKHFDETPYNDGNAGFLRREAFLSIIFVADEPEQSEPYRPISAYLNFFKGLKGQNMLRIHGITGSKSSMPSPCNLHNGDRFHTLIEATGGTWIDICTPTSSAEAWTAGLKTMSEGAFGFVARFNLRGLPDDINEDSTVDERDIELRVNGNPYPPLSSTMEKRWSYDPVSNAIDFEPFYVPKPGSQITATYTVACASPR